MKKTNFETLIGTIGKVTVIIFLLIVMIFLTKIITVDWEKVSEDSANSIENILEGVRCEIKYENFSYNGMCGSDSEELWKFLNKIENPDSTRDITECIEDCYEVWKGTGSSDEFWITNDIERTAYNKADYCLNFCRGG